MTRYERLGIIPPFLPVNLRRLPGILTAGIKTNRMLA